MFSDLRHSYPLPSGIASLSGASLNSGVGIPIRPKTTQEDFGTKGMPKAESCYEQKQGKGGGLLRDQRESAGLLLCGDCVPEPAPADKWWCIPSI
ncbi:hypothetical protein N7453_004422 [Penicillium expansum]|nr:hypothetical protein N7453_004422 [Penicillium expansum]